MCFYNDVLMVDMFVVKFWSNECLKSFVNSMCLQKIKNGISIKKVVNFKQFKKKLRMIYENILQKNSKLFSTCFPSKFENSFKFLDFSLRIQRIKQKNIYVSAKVTCGEPEFIDKNLLQL